MPTVTIRREDGQTIEISDLTFEQAKELAGVNGHGSTTPRLTKKRTTDIAVTFQAGTFQAANDIHGFISSYSNSERAKSFISALRDHPNGIDAHDLARLLNLNDPRQIGGFTGGGLAKIAKKFGIKMKDIYKSEVTFPAGKRTRIFYPGKLVKSGAI